jgi:hypothetical protein
MRGIERVFVAFLAAFLLVSAHADAGPGNEEPGQELDVDEAYQAHVSSLLSAIQMSEGKSDVVYSDLKPQLVDIHTIHPRIPALKVGMNALGHKLLHVHSDESEGWSAEIMSSGLTAGFSLTDRQKGLQKGTEEAAGEEWSMYSAAKIFRVKDVASGDVLQVQDGLMTLQGNKGAGASKPRMTIMGAKDSVPRLTLVSKDGQENAKHVSLYNRYGKFGVFSGTSEKSIFHLTADGSEMLMTSANAQPHITIESTEASKSQQELIFKAPDSTVKMYHKSSNFGICKMVDKECKSFIQATGNGETIDLISSTTKAILKVSHALRDGNSELQLVSQDKLGDLTSTDMYNEFGTLGFRTSTKSQPNKKLFSVSPDAKATFHGKMEVEDTANFKRQVTFGHNVDVAGIVTMEGKSVNAMFTKMEQMERESREMKSRMDDLMDTNKELRNSMMEMQQSKSVMMEKMDRMMTAMELMQQTTAMSR